MSITVSYETVSIKYWRDLDIRVRGRSRSLKMAPFDNHIWLTIGLPLLYLLPYILTLKSGLGVTQGHWNWYHRKFG